MELTIEITGDVVEWQELLNGTQILSLDGASADGQWTLSGALSWNIGLRESAGEGDLTLGRANGAEIFATLTRADVRAVVEREVEDADYTMRLEYEIDGGAGEYEGAAGTATTEGALSRVGFNGRWVISIRE
ncbi:MAG: hypothetical protein M3P30_07445 [Chloroflexota bacterium]|nr:hypothetical protein [Chloroflexota bacterium]